MLGVELFVVNATSDQELDSAFEILVQRQADAFFVASDLFLNSRADQIVALAARHRLPGSYPLRECVEAGGLMSYGASLADAFHWTGTCAGRILGWPLIALMSASAGCGGVGNSSRFSAAV
jgi:putative ABC transport system substrate-binding protein